jgi:head-tail adaptor
MIQLDEFREYISIMHGSSYKNSVGQIIKNWSVLGGFFAAKYNWQNRDKYEGQNLINSDIAIFTIYFDARIKTEHRIIWENKIYQITGIKEIGFREGLELTAQYKSNYEAEN